MRPRIASAREQLRPVRRNRTSQRWAAAIAAATVLAFASAGEAQQRLAIRGVVADEAGVPLEGVQVFSRETQRGTVTADDGSFALLATAGESIEVRFTRIGYVPERLSVQAEPGAAPLRVVLRATPLELPGLDVTATPGSRDALAVTQATSHLAGAELERELSSSLAQTLRMEPGVAVRFMGPAATMPVLRGLTGDRVLVLQDGQRTADLAGSADDHGVTIDPLAAQRVEIVRGPATLMYGNNAVAGAVNVISGDIPINGPRRLEGAMSLQSESAFPGMAASARTAVPLGRGWATAARIAARSTDDMRIPRDPLLGTRLTNTDASNIGGALGIGRAGEKLSVGAALRTYHFEYGLPVPPATDAVGLKGRRYEASGRSEITPAAGPVAAARLDAATQDYGHDELDEASGDLLQRFRLRTHTANVLLRQRAIGPAVEGAWGASLLNKQYAATGPQALTPAAESRGIGFFGFQEVVVAKGGPFLQLGGRFDSYRISSASSEKFSEGRVRRFDALSGAAGVRVPFSPAVSVSIHLGRSFRAPTVEELYSHAAHAGTGAVELGDADLAPETGASVEAMLRVRSGRVSGQASLYRNAIRDYVYLAARGDTVLYGATLPILQYAQRRAVLRGAEGSLEWAASRRVVLGIMGDYLHASLEDGTPLSFMPPPRLGLTARWEGGVFSAGGDVHHELAQNRVGEAAELPTPAHTIVRVHAALRFRLRDRTHSITVRGENLGNELHREATSRIKDFAPGPGRNVSLAYRLYY